MGPGFFWGLASLLALLTAPLAGEAMAGQAQISQTLERVREGDHFTLFFRPPVPANCAFRIRVNAHSIQPGESAGGLKAIGFGATMTDREPATTATFEALKNDPDATVTFEVFCPPTAITPQTFDHIIGKGAPPSQARPAGSKSEEKGPPPIKRPDDDVTTPTSKKDPFDGKDK